MVGNGIFDEDDWGDTDDFFQQIDQVVLQHSKPGQVRLDSYFQVRVGSLREASMPDPR